MARCLLMLTQSILEGGAMAADYAAAVSCTVLGIMCDMRLYWLLASRARRDFTSRTCLPRPRSNHPRSAGLILAQQCWSRKGSGSPPSSRP